MLVPNIAPIIPWKAVWILVLITALVFLLDLFTPLGINDGYFYAISILVTLWIPGKTSTYITVSAAVFLIILGYFIGLGREEAITYSFVNRLFAIVGIFVTAFSVLKNKDKERMMSLQNAELQQSLEKLNRSNAELEEYAYMASHDLQEPLRKITSYISLLKKRIAKDTDEETSFFLSVIVASAQKMRALINGFLSFSQIGKGRHLTNIDTGQVLSEVVANMQLIIHESKAKVISGRMPVIIGVDKEIRQMFNNLINNAIKFRKTGLAPEIHVDCVDRGTEWLFSVSDNGIGIKEEYFDKLFVIFQRLHVEDEYPGLGIGLATCEKIVELNGGKIWVTSQPGKGSTFYFTVAKQHSGSLPA